MPGVVDAIQTFVLRAAFIGPEAPAQVYQSGMIASGLGKWVCTRTKAHANDRSCCVPPMKIDEGRASSHHS